jgi:hypothetical protein
VFVPGSDLTEPASVFGGTVAASVLSELPLFWGSGGISHRGKQM